MSYERPEPALRSSREGDPEIELQIDAFVMQLGETVDALQDAEAAGQWVALRELASPLVERCRELGYDSLSDAERRKVATPRPMHEVIELVNRHVQAADASRDIFAEFDAADEAPASEGSLAERLRKVAETAGPSGD